jgi:hypothetical protein
MSHDLQVPFSTSGSSSFIRRLLGIGVGVGAFVSCFALSSNAKAFDPKSVLIYYGWPSYINGSAGDPSVAELHFADYDYVVLGRDLELPGHPDNQNTASIVAALNAYHQPTQPYGYIHLGATGPGGKRLCIVTNTDPNIYYGPCLRERAQLWNAMGVRGVLLDEFGFDYGNDRARQNAAVAEIHALPASRVIANAWNPDDVFSGSPATLLDSDDFYFFESHTLSEGNWVDLGTYKTKAEKLRVYQTQSPFLIMSITTDPLGTSTYSDARFRFSWIAAHIYDHEATGWGEPNFSASDSVAPLRTPPMILGEDHSWYTSVVWGGNTGNTLWRGADECTYSANFVSRASGVCEYHASP